MAAEGIILRKTTPTQRTKFRRFSTLYSLRAEASRLNRGYSLRRPGRGYGLAPESDQLDDCSFFCSKNFYWAGNQSGVHIADPIDGDYTGLGNTESIQEFMDHEVNVNKMLVGDIALWGKNEWDTTHAAIVRKAGTRKTAVLTSHGHQSWNFNQDAPNGIILATYTNNHFIGVFRHPALL